MKIENTKNFPEGNSGATKSETAPTRRTRKDFVGIKKLLQNEGVLILIIISLLVILVFFKFNPLSFKSNGLPSAEIIVLNGCEECFDINKIIQSLEDQGNFNIKEIKNVSYDSKEGKSIIEKYEIKKIPALILKSRKIEEINIGVPENMISKGKNYILFEETAPYLDLNSGEVKGIVNLKEIFDSSCKDCANPSNIQKQLERLNVKIGNYEKIDYLSTEGQEIIKKNNINFLPVIFISKNIEEYWWTFNNLKDFLIASGEYYFFKEPIAPYKEISTGKIKGKVNITYITNKSCEDCFNVTQLKDVFGGTGIYIFSERYVDVNNAEGKNLLEIYNITAIPTVVLSSEINDYTSIKDVLEQVGTFEKDNNYVFRKLDILKVKYQKTGNERR